MRIIGLVLAALALAGASAAYAFAAAPTHDWVTIDDTFTWDDCGFPVEESVDGTLQLISWFDDAGNRTRQNLLAPDFHVTWRNAETGESVSSASPYVVRREDNRTACERSRSQGSSARSPAAAPRVRHLGPEVIRFSESGIEGLERRPELRPVRSVDRDDRLTQCGRPQPPRPPANRAVPGEAELAMKWRGARRVDRSRTGAEPAAASAAAACRCRWAKTGSGLSLIIALVPSSSSSAAACRSGGRFGVDQAQGSSSKPPRRRRPSSTRRRRTIPASSSTSSRVTST